MRTKHAIVVCITGLAMSGWASSVSAHHAFAAEFDANKPVNFKGTITKMEWVNPHTWLHIDVKAPDGKVENWAIEAGTPNVLFRRGFTKDSLLPGAEVVVDGYQSKDGSHRANGRDHHGIDDGPWPHDAVDRRLAGLPPVNIDVVVVSD